jgi:ribonuclease BN (tRNA processing enzyme)
MKGQLSFGAAVPGRPFEQGPFRILPIALPHPNGCVGYRIEADGAAFVYATDVELAPETLGGEVRSGFEGADVLCLDAQYTPQEYRGERGAPKRGWGHSTMMDAAQVAALVAAKRLLLFHHDPARTDDQVEHMAEQARAMFAASEPAREGKRLFLGERPSPAV